MGDDLAERARERLTTALDQALGERFRHPGGKPDVYDVGVVVRIAQLLESCPGPLAAPAEDYEDTTRTTARRIGRMALRCRSHDPDLTVEQAVERAIEERDDWPQGLRGWVDGQDRAERSAVIAAATTWATGALRVTRWSPAPVWTPASSVNVDVPDRLVRLSATPDAALRTPAGGTALLVVEDSADPAADRLVAGFTALVHTLLRRTPPERVTVASPSTGTARRVTVDAGCLDLAVDRVVEVVAWRGMADVPVRPGRRCRWCHLLESCDDGAAYVARSG